MAHRHKLAIESLQTTDLRALAQYLQLAVEDALLSRAVPHTDSAIQVITHQIAFAGNGDMPFLDHYDAAVAYCRNHASNYEIIGDIPNAPVLSAS